MNLLTDKFWRESKPESEKLMAEIHNGVKHVLEEHSHFFKKFLEMFQTLSREPKMF